MNSHADSDQSHCTVYSLSVELVLRVLSYLEYVDLISCGRVSVRLRNIIRDDTYTQYRIELGLEGYVEGDRNSLSIPERLDAFRRVKRAWRAPDLRPILLRQQVRRPADYAKVRLPISDSLWYLRTLNGAQLTVLNLSQHTYRSKDDALWPSTVSVSFDFTIVDCSVNEKENVLALLTKGRIHLVDLQKLMFESTAVPPGRAEQPSFNLLQSDVDVGQGPYPPKDWDDVDQALYISGDWIEITKVNSEENSHVILYHWPSGRLRTYWISSDDLLYHSGILKGNTMLVMRMGAHFPVTAYIDVYSLSGIHECDVPPTLLASFGLPALREEVSWLNSQFCFWWYPTERSHDNHFHADQLLMVHISLFDEWLLFTPISTFLSHDTHNSYSPAARVAPWETWGPRSTRACRLDAFRELPVLCGWRAVFPNYIWDFNPRNLRESSCDKVMTSPSYLPTTVGFECAVETRLPYRVTRWELQDLSDDSDFFEEDDALKLSCSRVPLNDGDPWYFNLYIL